MNDFSGNCAFRMNDFLILIYQKPICFQSMSLTDRNSIASVLLEQRTSFLRKSGGVSRTILQKVERYKPLPHTVVITGLRRTGKSTLLRQIASAYYHNEDFHYINFEDERLIGFPAERFNELYEILTGQFGQRRTFLIDEIQNVPGFERFVRRFLDDGYKFYITGSSANLLSREIGTKLTGRHADITVYPFSFPEYLKFSGISEGMGTVYTTKERAVLKSAFDSYLTEGGMPEFMTYKEYDILTRTYEDVVIKDIALRYGLSNPMELRELFQYLITNFGSRFSYTRLKNSLGFGSVNTVKSYIHSLTETYFAAVISKFDYSIRKQISNEKKLYVADNGFIPRISLKVTRDYGRLLENLVHNELARRGSVYYFADGKSECDFILQQEGSINGCFQVSWNITPDNQEREYNGLINALEFFGHPEGTILTSDQEYEYSQNGKTIHVYPVWKWLLNEL